MTNSGAPEARQIIAPGAASFWRANPGSTRQPSGANTMPLPGEPPSRAREPNASPAAGDAHAPRCWWAFLPGLSWVCASRSARYPGFARQRLAAPGAIICRASGAHDWLLHELQGCYSPPDLKSLEPRRSLSLVPRPTASAHSIRRSIVRRPAKGCAIRLRASGSAPVPGAAKRGMAKSSALGLATNSGSAGSSLP